MINVLITGKNSYVGKNVEKWLGSFPNRFSINSISLRSELWKNEDFTDYDVIIHVAGIAHIKETKVNEYLYYKINRDLAYEVATKAKAEGVKQFIFISSMSVYGIESGVIGPNSPLNPKSNYGKSKLQAEELILSLEEAFFKVAILRPPMIYGKDCQGNYPRLAKLAVNTLIFPQINNKRSMIYIDNLCEFVRLIIEHSKRGIFHPQNKEYVCTSEMVRLIAKYHGKKIWMTKLFNFFIRRIQNSNLNKIFGDLVYDMCISETNMKYHIFDFETSIFMSESEKRF